MTSSNRQHVQHRLVGSVALLTVLQVHTEKLVELCGERRGVLDEGGGGGATMPCWSVSMPSCPTISIHPHLPAHRPPPMGWLCLPVCL